MQVAVRHCTNLFEVFFSMSEVKDYAWHRNLGFNEGLYEPTFSSQAEWPAFHAYFSV